MFNRHPESMQSIKYWIAKMISFFFLLLMKVKIGKNTAQIIITVAPNHEKIAVKSNDDAADEFEIFTYLSSVL